MIRLRAAQRTATVLVEGRLSVVVDGDSVAEIGGGDWIVLDRTPQSARLASGGIVVRVEATPEGVTGSATGAAWTDGERSWSRAWNPKERARGDVAGQD